jgi:hypothetical protein
MSFQFEAVSLDQLPPRSGRTSNRPEKVLELARAFDAGKAEAIVLTANLDGKPLDKSGTRASLVSDINAAARNNGWRVMAFQANERVYLQKADPPAARPRKAAANGSEPATE